MKYKVYSVFDSKAEAYMRPMYFQTKGLAIRSFSEAVNDGGKSDISKYPADFVLFELGDFDELSGTFLLHKCPISVGVALEFLKSSQEVGQ